MSMQRKLTFITLVGLLLFSLGAVAAFATEGGIPAQTHFNDIVVFVDADRDGIADPEEQPVEGVTLTLKNAYNVVGSQLDTSGPNGKVFIKIPGLVTWLWDYYLEVTDIPAGYQISPAYNSLFGLDGRTGYCVIEMKNNRIVSFGGQETVYVPLVNMTTTDIQVTTTNSTDSNKVYPGVSYDLYQYIGGEFVKIDTQLADNNGVCRFEDVNIEFAAFIKAANLAQMGLAPYDFLGTDNQSAYLTLTAPEVSYLVTLYELD